MERLEVNGVSIEYGVQGNGEPVLLIPLALVPDGLARPLLAQPELTSRYQLIYYHRRGQMGSTRGSEPPTCALQARDAAALLKHLGVKTAHVVGHSFGGLIALQLALDEPALVHSLALLEPVLRMVPSGRASMENTMPPMMGAYRSGDKQKAVGIFSDAVFGPNWRSVVDKTVPGGSEQAVKEMDSFVPELAAFQDWQFGPAEAAKIRQPVLSVVGTQSQPMMKEGRELLHSWFPQTEDSDPQSTHLLQMQDPQVVAHDLAHFFARHPIS